MIRMAAIGAGAFGRNHVRVVAESARAELKYVVDTDLARAREYAEARGAVGITDFRELAGQVEAAGK